MTFSSSVLSFYKFLSIDKKLPAGVQVMNPYHDDLTFDCCRSFYDKYYSDNNTRTLLLGINPGRFGSGTTGISFTDPIRLENICGIANPFPKKPELSADFIYRMISEYGGPEKFYSNYFISAVSPLGFTKDGKNINYYDEAKLETAIGPFVIDSINKIIGFGINREVCYCIGEGKNLKFLSGLNKDHSWFKEIIPLSHPRFIMQYKRKHLDSYIRDYLMKLKLHEK
jgi:hypothetical protein